MDRIYCLDVLPVPERGIKMRGCLMLGFLRLLRRPARLAGLCLLPAVIFAAGMLLPPQSLDSPLHAGICLPEGSSGAAALWDTLCQTDQAYVIFHMANETEITENVAAGKWECGFILHPEFETRYQQEDCGWLATVITSRSGTLSPILEEAFSAALYHIRAPWLATAYAAQNKLADANGLAVLRQQIADGLPENRQMNLIVESVHGQTQTGVHFGMAMARSVCQGLIAIFLFLYGLLAAADLHAVRQTGWFARMAAFTGQPRLLAGLAAAQFVTAGLCGIAAYGFTAYFFAAGKGFIAVLLYTAMLAGLAFVLAWLPGASQWLAAILPFAPAVCLIFCPVLFDAGQFFAPAGALSAALPPTWLLRAFDGGGLHILAAACIIIYTIAYALAAARR